MDRILVVDDEPGILHSFKKVLGRNEYHVSTASSGEEAVEKVKSEQPDLIIMDINMPGMDGLETLRHLKQAYPSATVIIMTAFSSSEKAITAMKHGAFDYITKPVENAHLLSLVERAMESGRMQAPVVLEGEEGDGDRIIGKSPAMIEIYKKIGQVAKSSVTVLLRGETGTGKELLARAICQHSGRADTVFLPVNCAAIPENLLESELFGHERGAFTGADTRKIGKFEQCDKGTMFLDEIGDMALVLQAKLLRVLQDGSFQRLGGTETITTDVRIIAATNRDLDRMVKEGKFREDLYWRLNVVDMFVPPLRTRKEDIGDLVQYFIRKYNREFGRNIRGVSPDVIDAFMNYDWPGNIRELQSVIQRGMILCRADILSREDCELPGARGQRVKGEDSEEGLSLLIDELLRRGGADVFRSAVGRFEGLMIRKALDLTHNNQTLAAKLLGISRNTLREKLGHAREGDMHEK